MLGNLDAQRDWGYAPEFCQAIFRLMHQVTPRNCEIGTGETHTIREFVNEALRFTGLSWDVIATSDQYKRPFELDVLKANPQKYEWLGWKPTVKFKELVKIMVEADCGDYLNADPLSRQEKVQRQAPGLLESI